MNIYMLIGVYVVMAIVTGYIHISFYYERTFSDLIGYEEPAWVIFGALLWPIFLPFLIIHVLSMITSTIKRAIKNKIQKKNEKDAMLAKEKSIELRERQLAIQKLEYELGMPLSQMEYKNPPIKK